MISSSEFLKWASVFNLEPGGGGGGGGDFGFRAVKTIAAGASYTVTPADKGVLIVLSGSVDGVGPNLNVPAGLGASPFGFGALYLGDAELFLIEDGATFTGQLVQFSQVIIPANTLLLFTEYQTNVYDVSAFSRNFLINNGVATIDMGAGGASVSLMEPVASFYNFINADEDFDVFMPQMDISNVPVGSRIRLYNLTSFVMSVKTLSATLLETVQPFTYTDAVVTDISTPAGSFEMFLYGTAAAAQATNNGKQYVCSMNGTGLVGNFPSFSDTVGTLQNSGLHRTSFQINNGFSAIDLSGGSVILTNPFPAELAFQGQVNDVATVTLPDMTQTNIGFSRGQVLAWVNGSSTRVVGILDFTGTLLVTLQPLAYARAVVADTSTSAGTFVIGVSGTVSALQTEDVMLANVPSELLVAETNLLLTDANKIFKAGVANSQVILEDVAGLSTYPEGFSFTLTSDLINAAAVKFIPQSGQTVLAQTELVVPFQCAVTLYKNSAMSTTDWQVSSRDLPTNYPLLFASGSPLVIDLAWSGNTIISSGADSMELPVIGFGVGQAANGVNYTLVNGTSTPMPISASGGNTIGGFGPTVTLYPGQSLTITTNGISGSWFIVTGYTGNGAPKTIDYVATGYNLTAADLGKTKINNESSAATINVPPNLIMPVNTGWYTTVTCQNPAGVTLAFAGGDVVTGSTSVAFGITAQITKTFSSLPIGASGWQIDQSA